jgi:hypothetical protein
MKNLRMTIELSPEATYITSPAFGNRRVLMKSATSNHIVLDLCTLEALPLNLPRIIQNLDFNPNYPSFMTSPELVTAQAGIEGSAQADSRGEEQKEDTLSSFPATAEPAQAEEPQSQPILPGNAKPQAKKRIRVNADRNAAELGPGQKQAAPDPNTTGADQSKGIIPPSLEKLHQRLSKEVELYKLHVKHYHMSPTQFRKRTSQLALPDTVYEKYEKVCKGCSVCAKPSTAPSRSRISGIRADNFGDLIFVDHAELKFQS